MLFLTTHPRGFEDVVSEELRELGFKPNVLGQGRLIFEGRPRDIPKINFLSRTIHRLIVLLRTADVEKLNDIYREAFAIPWEDFILPGQSFAVRSERHGKHEFTSIDINRVIGQAVIDRYLQETGRRLKVNLKNPDVLIRAELNRNFLWIGIDTTGESLHRRGYRVYQHPSPLMPTIAVCLLRLVGWKGEPLLDPMAGGGTIPIEAALMGRNVPPGKWRRDFLFRKLAFVDNLSFLDIVVRSRESKQKFDICGMEKFRKHVIGARRNAKSAGVADTVRFFQGDATTDPFPNDPEIIVVNPPYGLRCGSKRIIWALYHRFLENLRRRIDSFRLCTITSETEAMEHAMKTVSLEIIHERRVMYNNLPVKVYVAER